MKKPNDPRIKFLKHNRELVQRLAFMNSTLNCFFLGGELPEFLECAQQKANFKGFEGIEDYQKAKQWFIDVVRPARARFARSPHSSLESKLGSLERQFLKIMQPVLEGKFMASVLQQKVPFSAVKEIAEMEEFFDQLKTRLTSA